ncbi:hypothetical protein EMPS_06407 [Entomortierella parvispora]|uniref:F-box domain-containing protein n=1 Tax=Entomortierella parvispora TaxID=205924 RepID=A0A9P3LXE9_9FUNG|nr:hypothetical protein EMPS_06407 [Entomortierella parvispora]
MQSTPTMEPMMSPRHFVSPSFKSASRLTVATAFDQVNMASLDKLPTEIVYCILQRLSPRHMIPLTQVCKRLRILVLCQLSTVFDMRLPTPELSEDAGDSKSEEETTEKELPTLFDKDNKGETGQDGDSSMKRTFKRHTRRILRSKSGQNDSRKKNRKTTPTTMSDFELYSRMLLAEFYEQENPLPALTDGKEVVGRVLVTAKAILRRLYLSDSVNDGYLEEVEALTRYKQEFGEEDQSLGQQMDNCVDRVDALGFRHAVQSTTSTHLETTMTATTPPPPTPLLNPYVISKINMHVIARVIADQVCRGICLPETAVLILQCLTSLRDQDHFHYLVNIPERNASLRVPVHEDRISMGQLCFQYLVPNIMTLLRPPSSQQTPASNLESYASATTDPTRPNERVRPGIESLSQSQASNLTVELLLPNSSPKYNRPQVDHTKTLTAQVLLEQQELMQSFPSISCRASPVVHQSRVLCFLPLLGRHFNTLPTSTFIETFLDRSKGDLPIDRAAVMVYGFMCVLDLETGKANLASDSYRIFERSMPTQGRVQAEEMVRIVERHRLLMRGFLMSSPTFSSSRVFRQNLSSQGVL